MTGFFVTIVDKYTKVVSKQDTMQETEFYLQTADLAAALLLSISC